MKTRLRRQSIIKYGHAPALIDKNPSKSGVILGCGIRFFKQKGVPVICMRHALLILLVNRHLFGL
ncbi:MAG: hypothetical protein LBS18_03710, partial [Clostridiales bacterium]|nr:hypothetical protein [Clostridiales bacterium]